MKPKHTPGPWRVHERFDVKKLEIRGPNDEDVALIKSIQFPAYRGNARLIAAAPELLRALKDLREAFLRYCMPPETSLYEITEANVAINKAEGSEIVDGKSGVK